MQDPLILKNYFEGGKDNSGLQIHNSSGSRLLLRRRQYSYEVQKSAMSDTNIIRIH